MGGVTLPLALADLGLIDEYELVVQPILAGHGPTLFAGLSERLDLKLVGRQEFGAGPVALPYQPVESRLEGRLPLGTRVRHNAEGRHRRALERRLEATIGARSVGPTSVGQPPISAVMRS